MGKEIVMLFSVFCVYKYQTIETQCFSILVTPASLSRCIGFAPYSLEYEKKVARGFLFYLKLPFQ